MPQILYSSLISIIQSDIDFDALDSDFPDISSIFKIPRYDYANENAKKRFVRAKELFELSAQNSEHGLPAFYYKLKDIETLEGDYVERLEVIKNQFMSYLGANITVNNIIMAFDKTLALASIANREIPSAWHGKLAEKSTIDIICFLFNQYLSDINNSKINLDLFNGKWFDDQNTNVKRLAAYVFYQIQTNIAFAPSFFADVVDNINMAINQGRIYSPTANLHNWGLNVCWVLGIIFNKIPIKIISRLVIDNVHRRRAPHNPSAFALEIAVALEAGYAFRIEGSDLLLSPTELTNRIINGLEPNIYIPNTERQIELFNRLISDVHQQKQRQSLVARIS